MLFTYKICSESTAEHGSSTSQALKIFGLHVTKQTSWADLLGDTWLSPANFNVVLLMPKLQRHHFLFNISHFSSVLAETSRWNSCSSSSGDCGCCMDRNWEFRDFLLPGSFQNSPLCMLKIEWERQTEAVRLPVSDFGGLYRLLSWPQTCHLGLDPQKLSKWMEFRIVSKIILLFQPCLQEKNSYPKDEVS